MIIGYDSIMNEANIDFIGVSMESFTDIFECIGLDESSLTVITEASVKEVFTKIKNFIKSIFEKFVNAVKNAFNIDKRRAFLFNRFYEAHSLNFYAICKAILNRKIPTEKLEAEAFDTYAAFSLDKGIKLSKFSFGVQDFNITAKDYAQMIAYTQGLVPDDHIDEKLAEKLADQKRSCLKLFIVNKELREIAEYHYSKPFESLKENKNKIITALAGPHLPLRAENIGAISSNMAEIYQNIGMFTKQYKKCQDEAKKAYEKVIKELNDIEDRVIKDHGTKYTKVMTAVKKYSNYYSKCLQNIYDVMAIGLATRAGQITSYLKIMKYSLRFLPYVPTGIVSPNKYKESTVFDSVEFV